MLCLTVMGTEPAAPCMRASFCTECPAQPGPVLTLLFTTFIQLFCDPSVSSKINIIENHVKYPVILELTSFLTHIGIMLSKMDMRPVYD